NWSGSWHKNWTSSTNNMHCETKPSSRRNCWNWWLNIGRMIPPSWLPYREESRQATSHAAPYLWASLRFIGNRTLYLERAVDMAAAEWEGFAPLTCWIPAISADTCLQPS